MPAPLPGGTVTYDWPVQIGFADTQGQLIGAAATDWKLSSVLPGTTQTFQTTITALPAGAQKLMIRVVNPLTNGKPLSFANATQDRTLAGWLTIEE